MYHMEMDHKRCKIGPKTPQMFIVHPILMHIVLYVTYKENTRSKAKKDLKWLKQFLSFKCIQYQPKPQNMCVYGDRHAKAHLCTIWKWTTNGAK